MNNDFNNLIIGGVHKAGTTSLYTYLSWHPSIAGSDIKETHFFSGSNYKKKYKSYDEYFKNYKGEKYKLEASPEYIYERKIAINNILDNTINPKIIFIFRNPADKILSSFNHRKKNLLFDSDYNFEDFERDHLNISSLTEIDKNNSYSKELYDGVYVDYIKDWFEAFGEENIRIIFFDDLKNKPHEVVENLTKWLNIDSGFYDNKNFTVENKSVVFKNASLQKYVMLISKNLEPVFRKNYKLKLFLRNIYYALNVDNKNKESTFSLNRIQNLYLEKNKELKSFLIAKGYKNFPEWL